MVPCALETCRRCLTLHGRPPAPLRRRRKVRPIWDFLARACLPREPALTRPGFRYGGFRTGPRASLPAVFLSVPWHVMPELWSGCGWVKLVRGYVDSDRSGNQTGTCGQGCPPDQCSSHPCLLTLIRTVLGAHYPSACPPRERRRPRWQVLTGSTRPRSLACHGDGVGELPEQLQDQ